jgi:GTPase involved in cell partitioning and DNA repair
VKILDKAVCLIDKLKKEADIPKVSDELQKYQALLDKEAMLIQEKQEKERLEANKMKLKE